MKRQFRRFGYDNEIALKNPQMQHLPTNPDALMEQDTVPLPAIHESSFLHKSGFAQRIAAAVLIRVQEPEPEEWSHTLRQKAVKSQVRVLGWLPMLTLTQALGTFLAVYACAYSLYTSTDEENYLWLGLLLIFAPSFLRLLSPLASRPERIGILCSAAISIYLVKVILSPLHFLSYDEYLHWRTVDDIVRTEHLFSENSMLPVSPRYPGLEIVTDAFSSLSGLNTFTTGLIVIGIARMVMILSLFTLSEQITKSARTAGIATMLYMCNDGFFAFDSLFIYESLALAIGAFMMFALARLETVGNGGRGLLLTAWIAVGALVTTHHVSDFFFVGLLVLWTVIDKFLRQPVPQSNLSKTALLGILLSVAWVVFVARPVINYLSAPVIASLAQLEGVLTGSTTARHLFVDHTGSHPTAIWQRLAMLSAVGLVTLGVPFGALCIWHRYRHKALPFMLGLVSLSYPLTQAFRVTGESANIPDRSAPYIFIAVSFALAIFITQMWPIRRLKWKQTILITSLVSLVFLGGNMLGTGPSWVLMPGGYVVGDDARSIDPESIQAAIWALSHLGPNNRISTDRSNSLLMSTYGDQRIVTPPVDGVYVSPVFYATQYYPWEVSILQGAQLHYLVVDLRLSTSLPFKHFYFEEGEPDSNNLTTPISRQALTKFDTVPRINREFDSGDIVIYDVGELTNAS